MAKKKFFLIVDTETTQTGKVADFGAVIVDKQGTIHREMGILVGDFFSDRTNHPLFHIYGDKNDVFSKASLPKRYERYEQMLQTGERYLASVGAVNRWLVKAAQHYNPVATAYNIAFDREKLTNSGIVFNELFPEQFCLWHAAVAKWGQTRAFREYVLSQHHFGNRTKHGNMTMRTNAEAMAAFITGNDSLEPHTALEDARDFERPILAALVKNTSPQVYMNPPPYNWRHWQLKDHFAAR
jgi:hypothetical protein